MLGPEVIHIGIGRSRDVISDEDPMEVDSDEVRPRLVGLYLMGV